MARCLDVKPEWSSWYSSPPPSRYEWLQLKDLLLPFGCAEFLDIFWFNSSTWFLFYPRFQWRHHLHVRGWRAKFDGGGQGWRVDTCSAKQRGRRLRSDLLSTCQSKLSGNVVGSISRAGDDKLTSGHEWKRCSVLVHEEEKPTPVCMQDLST